MARSIATNTTVELAELFDFVRPRHRMLLATTRRDGRPQISPVTGGVDFQGRIVISTYPARAKTRNAENDPRVSVLVLSDDWNGPWVQIDGDAEVLHMPEAADGLVDYFRSISGEHPDWEEYGRHAYSEQVADPNHPCSLGSDRDWGIPGRRGGATRSLSCSEACDIASRMTSVALVAP
jgi:PPOX class probable F420-dependent enzyme